MRGREIDLSLLEVGFSSAQYGTLIVESVCMFLCEHVCKCVYIKVFISCSVFSVLMPTPCCELVCTLRVRVSVCV